MPVMSKSRPSVVGGKGRTSVITAAASEDGSRKAKMYEGDHVLGSGASVVRAA